MNPKPFNTGYLEEQDGHIVYFAEYGNPKGEVVVTLHGGPGSKSKAKDVKPYDQSMFRVITFNQRGCGESSPVGETKANTTQDLVSDMERLRSKLHVKRWFVAGGSWGATLALAYAETHYDKVKGLLLSSIFLARPRDVEWAFTKNNGIERMFPDLWEKRIEFLDKYNVTPSNAANVLLERMRSASPKEVKEIAVGVSNWEGNLMNAQEDLSFSGPEDVGDEDIAGVKVFLHYEANDFFLKPDQLIKDLDKLKSIPAVIVHGRYDVLCPVEQTWEVQKQLANVETTILPTSNHKLTAEGEIAKQYIFNRFLDNQTNNRKI